jgi:hypothetical protein
MISPVHVISLGAGVQSSTMALMAAHGEITPMPNCAIFADTMAEPASVYKWLDWLESKLPFPVVRVSAGSLAKKSSETYFSKRNQKETVTGIPVFSKTGLWPRQCTKDFKIAPIDKEITRQMRRVGAKRCVKWIGISLDEAHRMKPARRTTVEHRWPLVDSRLNRGQLIEWMRRNGYPEPPRSACVFCPYHSDSEWRRLKREEPAEFESAAKFEHKLQTAYARLKHNQTPFLHRSLVPLRDVDFSTDEDYGQQVMFGNDCEGMCGV